MNKHLHKLLTRRFGPPSTASRKAYKRAVEDSGGSLLRPTIKEGPLKGLIMGAPVIGSLEMRTRLAQAGKKAFHRRAAGEGGTPSFWGYGSVFGVIDSYHEVTEKGCFLRSIEENFSIFKTLWQHRSSEPIGLPTEVREDDYGLIWDSSVETSVKRVEDRWPEIQTGLVNALSIGYWLREYWWDEENVDDWGWPLLHITDVDLIEVSAVTWGANPASFIEETRDDHEDDDEDEDEGMKAAVAPKGSPLAQLFTRAVSALVCDDLPRADVLETLSTYTGRSAAEVDQVLAGGLTAPPEELAVVAKVLGVDVDEVLEASVAHLT